MEETTTLSEGEWMDYTLAQIGTGQRKPYSRLSTADLEAIAEEHIGEHFSRYPFLY